MSFPIDPDCVHEVLLDGTWYPVESGSFRVSDDAMAAYRPSRSEGRPGQLVFDPAFAFVDHGSGLTMVGPIASITALRLV